MSTVFGQPSGSTEFAGQLALEVRNMMRAEADNAPRSQQRHIGPSEVGCTCVRRLGYRLMDKERVNVGGDPWATQVGRAVHSLMENTFRFGHEDAGRYLVEHRVTVRGGLTGSADLYDRLWGCVIDWKVVGDSSIKKYRREGPSQTYRTQAHLYGMGFANAGEKVERVAIVFLPRAASLDNMHVWSEPYDEQVALDALERMDDVLALLAKVDVERKPGNWKYLPADTSDCNFCPFLLPGSTDLGAGCPGPTA